MNYNPYSLINKTILVTGASSGIGRATAIECSKLGANVIITGRDKNRLNETFDQLIGDKDNHKQIIADLTNECNLKDLVDQLPKLDGLVNNAGTSKMVPINFINMKDLMEVQNINLNIPIFLTRLILNKKLLKNPSSIVFTSSISGTSCYTVGNAIYSTTKSGIDAYMKIAAKELGHKGIRCNSVNPGMVYTKLIESDALTKEQYEIDKKKYPLGRYGNPEEIALAIIYLLSDASLWVTGTALKIDGGFSL